MVAEEVKVLSKTIRFTFKIKKNYFTHNIL